MSQESADHVLGECHVRVDEENVGAALSHGIQAKVSPLVLNDRALHQFQTDCVCCVECVIRHHIDHAICVVGVYLVTGRGADSNVVHTFPGRVLKN